MSRAGLADTHAGLPLPGPREGVALTQFLSWPQMACGTLGRTQRVAAFWKLLFFQISPPSSHGGSCLRARRNGSHSPICLPSKAKHFTGLAVSVAAQALPAALSRGWGCSRGGGSGL